MKLSFLLVTMVVLQVSAIDSYAQKITLKKKNASLPVIFEEIKAQTGYTVFYRSTHLKNTLPVSVSLVDATLEEALAAILVSQDLEWAINEKTILIRERKKPVARPTEAVPRQELVDVQGAVTDAMGGVLVGATARVLTAGGQRTAIQTKSDDNGTFFLKAVPEDATLELSYIGYLTRTVAIKADVGTIILEASPAGLEEVVVVGYGTQKKRDLTGAVSSIRLDDAPVTTTSTISHLLAGAAAGLQANMVSAQPGGYTAINIRGATSVGAGNEPLIVIDGFPITSSGEPGSGNRYDGGSKDFILSSLNPNDIESIDVLKDASATAIYGARAGHGVIIITTKRGKVGKPTVAYSASISQQRLADNYRMLSASEFMTEANSYIYERFLIDNHIHPYGPRTLADFTFGPPAPQYTAEQISDPMYNTDWLGAITRRSGQQQHNLSINGGSEATQYQLSLGYFDQDGVIKSNDMNRVNARINVDQRIADQLKMGASVLINRNAFNNIPLGSGANEYAGIIRSAVEFSPLLPIKDERGEYTLSQVRPMIPNPASLLEITDKSVDERLLAMYFAEYRPLRQLTLKVNTGVDRKFRKRSSYLPKSTLYGRNANGEASINQYDNRDYLMEITAAYHEEFGKHKLGALVGHSYQRFDGEGLSAGNRNFVTDGYGFDNLGAGEFPRPSVGSWRNRSTIASFFGRLNYAYQDRYLLTVNFRSDGASNLAPGHQWGYFPSISGAWRFSDESFMKGLRHLINEGKVRIGYGETGNSNIGNGALDYYSSTAEYLFGGTAQRGVTIGQIGNPRLTWETTKEWNFGLDLALFNKVSITAEYYRRQIVDLLFHRQLISYFPVSSLADNIGTTQSKGFELTINSQNLESETFSWTTTGTFSLYRDTWKERAYSWVPTSFERYHDPLRAGYGYLTDGLIQAGQEVPHMPGSRPGQIYIRDIDSYQRDQSGNLMVDERGVPIKTGVPDGRIDDADKVFYGSWDPAYLVGLSNTLRYKQWDFTAYVYGTINRLMDMTYLDSWALGGSNLIGDHNLPVSIKEVWRSDNQGATRPGYTQMTNMYGHGDYFMDNVSFIRVRNLTLGYNQKVNRGISNIRIYVDVNNPFIFTNYRGIDPETDNSDVAYPNVRTFSAGIDIRF
ncbi:TonB-dependent receptor [Parapedobacter deserti]|uniref:TonB-dependent receptor n=1 Tax=Parapedobacter deserti TaxID=1912957 RepID=A0ABV7JGD9_9SPHI